jgi:hypothetical protein
MTAKSSAPAPARTRTRTATVSYPYHPLAACLEIAKGVREIGNGKQDVSRSLLASHLGVDEKSGDFAQKLASTKCYGLIDGRTEFKLTELSRGIFLPTEDPDRQRRLALLQACRGPGAFAVLIDRYDGSKLPSPELLGNVLSQELGIPESWKVRIVTYFIKSMQLSGALNQDGFLRHKAELQKLGSGSSGHIQEREHVRSQDDERRVDERRKPLDPAEDDNQEGVVVWKYPFKGRTLRIETPEDMTPEIWNKLKRYIDVLNPDPNA